MTAQQTIRYYQRSGELRKGYFYSLDVPFDTYLTLRMESESREWIVRESASVYGGQAWIEVCVNAVPRHDCPRDASHTTGYDHFSIAWADLHGGSQLAHFVRDCVGQSIVVTETFGRQLLACHLRGLALVDIPIRNSQAELREIPPFSGLDFQGRNCVRRYCHRIPEPNECPRCHFEPIVCPGCNETAHTCPHCKLELVGFSTEPHNRPFNAEIIKGTDFIVEAHDWDGNDFFAERYMTRRALRYLMSLDAQPFVAKPVWANVDRLSEGQLAALDAM